MSKDRVSVRNLLWGCPTWFLADFFCPTCPTHLSHQSVPRLFPNWVDRTELDGRDGRFIWTAWNKRTRKIEKTQVTPPHNPEVGGSSPPPATIKSLEIKRFQGFFLFSNRKGSDRTAERLCTKFGRFGGQNLVQNRWGMCRSSPLPCPSVDLKPPAAFCTENRVQQAVLFCGAISPSSSRRFWLRSTPALPPVRPRGWKKINLSRRWIKILCNTIFSRTASEKGLIGAAEKGQI